MPKLRLALLNEEVSVVLGSFYPVGDELSPLTHKLNTKVSRGELVGVAEYGKDEVYNYIIASYGYDPEYHILIGSPTLKSFMIMNKNDYSVINVPCVFESKPLSVIELYEEDYERFITNMVGKYSIYDIIENSRAITFRQSVCQAVQNLNINKYIPMGYLYHEYNKREGLSMDRYEDIKTLIDSLI